MEIVNSIAAKISEYAIDAIVHQLGYLVHYNRNIKDFEKQAEDLESAIARVKGLIDDAENQGETIHQYVLTEFTKAEKIIEDIKQRNFSNVSCFNLFQRYRSSRKAKKLRDELSEFKANLDKLDKVGYRGPLPWMESDQGDLSFESRTLIMDDIIKALQDSDIYMIGVYGMGGIGKTTLVNQIASQVSKSKLFEPVIMAVVGQNPQVNNIQGQLADKLGFGFKEETEQGRADSLRNRLQQEEKVLIIIDDVWNGLDFKKVGIPIPSTNNRKGSKIIVTSRSHYILSNEMSIEKNFNVEDLTKDESWNLFKNKVGESIETNSQLKEIARKITNKCGKLPLALVLVAKALKGRPLAIWKDAFQQLNNPASEGINGVTKEAYTSIKLSYDHIESQEARTLFLLCSMFPDDYNIDVDDLSRYARGLEFLNGVHTLETTRNRIVKLIDDLQSSCLLQKSEPTWDGHLRVKMHDAIRDVAINIASNDDQMCTLSYGKGLNKVQDEKTDRHYTAIFANCVNFKDLHEELNFPKLKLLTLLDNDKSLKIPEDCFERMGNLKVLHLKRMSFSPSPSSFNHLATLRTLLLIDCHVENIDMIGKLKDLEILDFSESNITELPLSFSQLSRLKQLKVSRCRQLEVIQPGVISRMTKLEELFVDEDTFNDWEVGESNNCEQKKAKASISELGSLRCLTCLYLCIPNVRSLPEIQVLNNLELERFHIVIGKTQWHYFPNREKILDIKTYSRNDVLKELQLLERCEVLGLEGTCVRNVASKLKTSVHLRYLELENNEEVEYLVSELDDPNHDAFSILETLVLENMKRLETIINKGYSFKVFEKLKALTIRECDRMKYLFPFSIIKGLSNLESIEIYDCKMMEAIAVVMENEAPVDNKMEFRRLRYLKLHSLRKLKSFCGKLMKAKGLIESKSIAIVELKEEEDRANSITPFHCQITFPSNLESVSIFMVENVWHDLLFGNNIKELFLYHCKDIESVFTVKNNQTSEDVFRWPVPKLESLRLWNLPNLKHVWNNNKDIPYGILITFQSLKRVQLKECPQLKTLFPHSLTKHLQQLQKIYICQCGIDEIFGNQASDSEVSFPSLESLEIEDVNKLKIIWPNRLIVNDMSNLQSVKLFNCKSLKSIFTSNVMSALKRLVILDIRNCDSLEQVFEIHPMIELKEHREVASINLRELVLCNLPSLKHVWSNDPYEMYQFQDLNDVKVTECPKLITLFPPSMVRDLPHQLQCLQSNFDLERAKEEAQTLESVLVLEDNDFVIGKDRAKIPVSSLVGRNILFYFSADWSSPCHAFLPKLIEAYHKIKEKNDTFEVIFISSDSYESSFDKIFSRMPWLALPFGDPREASVSRTFKVQSIPMLVAIGSDGRIVTKDVIDLIRIHGAEAYPFTAGRVGELEIEKEEIVKRGPEKVKHTLHEEHELVLSRRKMYTCNGCYKEGSLWSYWCKVCDFDLHPNCALEK